MAYYTVRLRDVVESETHYGSPMKPTTKERIEMGRQKVFDFDYPLFDESYRKEFETRFLRTFYMNEISEETFGLWKFKLETWLNLHMPYYNQLYRSTLLEYDPLINTDYKVTSLGKKNVKFDEKGNTVVDTTVDKTGSKHFAEDKEGKTTNDGKSNTNTKNNLDSENNVKGNVNTDTTNTGKTDLDSNQTVTDTGVKNDNSTSNTTDNQFDRKITSDTPDSRLQITTNEDGTGVIEYASGIQEDKGKKTSQTTTSGHEDTENKRTNKQTSTTDNTETGNSKTDATSDTTHKENATGSSDTTVRNEENSTKNTVANTTTKDGTVGNVTGGSDTNRLTDEVKDYIEHRVGKQGVETYPEMVMKFRKAMINVDEQILRAIRKELFMIIY